MALQAGQLLISRQHLTLPEGITTVDTGLTQVNRGLSPDPPLGGSDPTSESNGVASRVQVTPLAPLAPWVSGDIHHGEPYVESTTGAVKVDFWVAAGAGEQTINVEFWDPHTEICPIDCDPYNAFSCQTAAADLGSLSFESGGDPPATVTNTALPGDLFLVVMVVRFDTGFDASNIITPVDAGWTLLRRANVDEGGGVGLQMAAFYRMAANTDPASYDFSWNQVDDNRWQVAPIVIAGFDPANPIQSDAAVFTDGSAATPFDATAPSLNAVEPFPLLIQFFAADDAATAGGVWSTDPPAPDSEVQGDPSGAVTMYVAATTILAVGPTGARVAEYDLGAAGGLAYSVLINPACGIFPDGSGG